jgi:hypothetical protein
MQDISNAGTDPATGQDKIWEATDFDDLANLVSQVAGEGVLCPTISPKPSSSVSPTVSMSPTRYPSIVPSLSVAPSTPNCVNNFNICYSLDMSGSVCTKVPPAQLCEGCNYSPESTCGDEFFGYTNTCCSNFHTVSLDCISLTLNYSHSNVQVSYLILAQPSAAIQPILRLQTLQAIL